ncbi:MAG TPA: type IV toxin-antitoxin system AbiEi family antitoxin domain-containing protein [Acidimicrobiales bacterium]|jgi:very-short-patch-repair endonuclease|nr:type IV toxin-antitoxin system AbiEi family antitoxin domain-containing protein [Acidimicrobiales bacterium]
MGDDWLDGRLFEFARARHGVFTQRQALALGFRDQQIRYRVRHNRWVKVSPGVYQLAGWPSTLQQRAMLAWLQLGGEAFASHGLAAMLRKYDGVSSASLEFTTSRRGQTKRRGVVLHHVTTAADDDWSWVDGIPTAIGTRIVVDMAADRGTSFEVLEKVFECAQRRGETSHDAVRGMVAARSGSGNRGIVRARRLTRLLLDDGQVNHSELETRFFQLLRRAGLPLPTRQRIVRRSDGRFAYADYAYDGVDGVIELLGFKWHSSREALTADAERSNEMQLQRVAVLQFTWDQVTKRKRHVVDQVAALLCSGRRHHDA